MPNENDAAEGAGITAENGQTHDETARQDPKPPLTTNEITTNPEDDELQLLFARAEIIRSQMQDEKRDPATIDGYLGRGKHGPAFLIDGKVLKVHEQISAQGIHDEVEILELLKGIPNTVQYVGSSVEKGAVVTELVPGKNIQHDFSRSIPQYSDRDLVQVINTVQALHDRGMVADPTPGNYNYDPETGFYIFDPLLARTFGENAPSLAQQVMGLRHMLSFPGPYDPDRTEEDQRAWERHAYDMSVRVTQIAKNNFPALYDEILQKDKQLHEKWGKDGGFIREPHFKEDSEVKGSLQKLHDLGLQIPG